MIKLAIIGGTGVYDPEILREIKEEIVETVYGDPVKIKVGTYADKEIAFLPRHGEKHGVPPHKINYRANMAALKKIGVQRVLATAAVGSLNQDMEPGQLTLLDQFIDFTKTRITTFHDGGEQGVVHTDFTHPYCKELREMLWASAKDLKIKIHKKSTYICTEGPRFESPAEIKMFSNWGADLVGMTNVPEVTLARELGLCYSTVCLVTNYAAGISPNVLTHQEVLDVMAENIDNVKKIMMKAIEFIPEDPNCDCASLESAISIEN